MVRTATNGLVTLLTPLAVTSTTPRLHPAANIVNIRLEMNFTRLSTSALTTVGGMSGLSLLISVRYTLSDEMVVIFTDCSLS